MENSFVTVGSFQHVYEAQAAEFHLAAEGIDCHLKGLNTVNMDWGLSNAIGYIKVQTLVADANRAREILHRMNHKKETDDNAESCLACGFLMPQTASACESCGWSFAIASEEAPSDHPDKEFADQIDETHDEPGALEDMRSFAKTMISGYLIVIAFYVIFAALAIAYAIFQFG